MYNYIKLLTDIFRDKQKYFGVRCTLTSKNKNLVSI